jgi:xanthine/uracil permease
MVSAVTLILPVLIVQDIGGTAAQAETMVRTSLLLCLPAGGSHRRSIPDVWSHLAGWVFRGSLFTPRLPPAGVVLKAIGDPTTCQKINDADWQRPDMVSVSRGLLADACGLAAAGLFGGMGQSASSSSIGLSNATGATSRYIGYAMGGVAITFAFIPKLAIVLVIMPKPVVGAACDVCRRLI